MEFMKKINELSKMVTKTATDTYNTVADKSGKFIEDTKLKISVSDKELEIEKIYEVIGKTVYDSYVTGEDVGKVFTKESKKVDKLLSEIDEMNKKILFNKGFRTCANCGEDIDILCSYCANCGEKQKPVKIKEDKKDSEKKEEALTKVCSECGLISDSKFKFCSKCGHSL
ncbi:MAG: zinc ribbon domain-containing protein [Clostridia bacterium]